MDNQKNLFVGFDVGSSSVHYAVLDEDKKVVHSPKPIMHFADPIGAIKEAWQNIVEKFNKNKIRNTAFTGTGANFFPSVMRGVTFTFDSVAIPKGAEIIAPDAKYVFHMGAKDPYFFNLNKTNGKKIIQEWRTGSKCGGGSGTLIEKQCRRLFEKELPNDNISSSKDERDKAQLRLEEMFKKAEQEAGKSREPSEFLARCGVIIQSDLIHKQNEGAKREDNLAGLFKTIAKNYKIDVIGNGEIDKNSGSAIATGGVLTNDLIRKNLGDFLGIYIRKPEHYHNIAAIGVALKGIEENNNFVFDPKQLDKVAEYSRKQRKFTPPLCNYLKKVNEKTKKLEEKIEEIDVIIGIDGGSTTTKGALVDLTGKLLDKIYIKTHGDPEKALKKVIKYLSKHKEKVNVKGIGTTGSARKLYERILVSKKKTEELAKQGMEITDKTTDEITCHALGIKHHDSEVDTIFEIGGQDMKFTSFSDDGTVKEAKMNYSCQAGSGQTLENMADVINLDVKSSLQEYALRAKRVPTIDSTCGVFMEMDENRLIAEGFSKEEIAAAILRATAASYYYKFVGGSQHVGEKCSAQGGPPLGKAFLAALAQVTGKEINAYPHREMFGALGAALDVIKTIKDLEKQNKKYASAFRGWDLTEMPLKKEKIYCKDLFKEKSCGIRNCLLEIFSIEDDKIITGGFCPRGNSEASAKPRINYVEKYHSIYEKHFKRYGCLLPELEELLNNSDEIHRKTIGIRRATATLGEKGIWSAALFEKLGFYPVASPESNEEIAKIGVENSRTEFCLARKLVTGHAAILNDNPNIEYLFNPSFIEHRKEQPPDLKYCIYTESEGYVLKDVLSLDENKQVNLILHCEDKDLLLEALKTESKRLGFEFTNKQIKNAIEYANEAEEEFKKEIAREGDKFLERIERKKEKAYVGIGRDYVILDPEASSNSGVMFSQVRGLNYIPQIFLDHKFRDIHLDDVAENEFWVQSVKILKANLFIAQQPNLFPIRMMNFGCGPDSLKIYQEEKIQQAADKPMLALLTDAQTNNAPFVTRTEAFERVVQQSHPKKLKIEDIKIKLYSTKANDKRIWLIPYMGDGSFMGTAALKYFGIDSQVLPTATQKGYEVARKYIHTEVCQPLKGVVGDVLDFLDEKIKEKGKKYVEESYLVMLPTTSGPCRFGKYKEILRDFANRQGLEKVPIAGPSSITGYFDIPLPEKFSSRDKIKLQQILFKGIQASDLLEDITLRFRPYAKNRQEINDLKRLRLKELEKVVEKGARTKEMVEWGKETVEAFKKTNLQNNERFPLVLYIGEIYMRHHDPYTNYVIEKLEEQGLEMIRSPIIEWINYINEVNQRKSKRGAILGLKNLYLNSLRYVNRDNSGKTEDLNKKTKEYLNKTLKEVKEFTAVSVRQLYIEHVGKRIARPFHKLLDGRHVLPRPIKTIETLEKENEFHGDIEGESPINSAVAYYLMHDSTHFQNNAYISGIFHVGPFTCMQEGVTTAKTEAMAKELRKKKPNLVFPIIHAFFGDSPNANLDAEIAVFKEQCYQKRDALKEKVTI
jgi:predicted CoA-substrate-specific enzyme activase